MERRELEAAAAKMTNLRGLLAVPAGLLFIVTGIANLGEGLPGDPVTFVASFGLLGAVGWLINRYYDEHYGRVRLSRPRQWRFGVASALCFGIPMVGGTILDFNLDLPVSLFSVLFGLGMLAWFAICVGLRTDHLVVWGGLVVVGLLPVWGGLDDRASAGWLPIGAACIVAGILDHLALVRAYGPAKDVHVGA